MEKFTIEIALNFVNQQVLEATKEDLSELEKTIFRGAWKGLTYTEIASNNGYSPKYINNYAGLKFWDKLRKVTKIPLKMKHFKEPLYEHWLNTSSDSSFSCGLSEFNLSQKHEVVERCSRVLLMPGALLKIKAPVKRGKTTLALNVLDDLHDQQGYRIVYLSLDFASNNDYQDIDSFVKWFCLAIGKELGISNQLDHLADIDEFSTPLYRCTEYLENIILSEDTRPLVICMDEIDLIFTHLEIQQDFFGLIRGWHERANHDKTWGKLRIILLYCKGDYGISNPFFGSPFNIGYLETSPEFTTEQVSALAEKYALNWLPENTQQLMDIVGGHPYLIDAMLSYLHLMDNSQVLDRQLQIELDPTSNGVYSNYLRYLWEEISKHPGLIDVWQRIIESIKPVSIQINHMNSINILLDIGLIIRVSDNCVEPYCQLFRDYFKEIIDKTYKEN